MASALTFGRPETNTLDCLANLPRIRGVCLDIDDTIVDFTTTARAALSDLIGRDDMWALWQRITEEHVAMVVSGQMDYQDMRVARTKAFCADLGLLLDDAVVAAMEARRLATMRSNWRTFSDVLPCLEWLRAAGLRMVAVTNASGAHQRTKLADVGLAGFFEAVIIAGEVGAAKPDPVIFRTACMHLDLPPEEVVHVGDKLNTDAVGARDAGLHGVWLNRAGGTPPVPERVHRLDTLADLPELLVCEFVTPSVAVPAQRG